MSVQDALNQYIADIQQKMQRAEAREHAYRPALQTLLDALKDDYEAVNDPKRSDAGAPDYIVFKGDIPAGFVECKDIGADLVRTEKSEQLQRYIDALPNLILTDYVAFRWYVGGELRETATLGTVQDGRLTTSDQGRADVARLLQGFATQHTPTVQTAEELATRMAGMTRELARLIENSLPDSDSLKWQKNAFAETLLPNLTGKQFADLYAQTIAYGLFAARVRFTGDPQTFTLQNAFWGLPDTNPFLKGMFQQIAPGLDPRVKWLANSLADLLARAAMEKRILPDFGRATRQQDPVVHFYETFLSAYDPTMREKRGVYYTPEPVVDYIVRSVDHLLKTRFNRPTGLADPQTLILDPAAGTGTFLYFVIQHIHETFAAQGQSGGWDQYVAQHLLKRIFGFELLLAPYAVAHMKLGIQLQDYGYQFQEPQRLGIYLTNTLEGEKHPDQPHLGFAGFITEEANAAERVKHDDPIMVVLGNPPYSGHSANPSRTPTGEFTWIGELVNDYYFVDGQPLGERNTKWLQDDYVKFIRFGQWRIEKTGEGVLAFVTNHGYLDNPTFRGMRQHLMQSFSDIYVINLHGNSRKKEVAPDGSPDQNVFDIEQGVAIGIFVRERGHTGPARVHHLDLWGSRAEKYTWLLEHSITDSPWKSVAPRPPYLLFAPLTDSIEDENKVYWSVTDCLPENGWGIATRKDYLLIDFSHDQLVERFRDIRALTVEKAINKYGIKTKSHWDFSQAHKQLSEDVASQVRPILFRPFDVRAIYYETCMIERGDHRFGLMRHLFEDNLSLITVRRSETSGIPAHFFCADKMSVLHSVSSKEGNFVFPLYLYPDPNELLSDSPWPLSEKGRRPNLSKAFVDAVAAELGLEFVTEGQGDLQNTFGPEDVFYYAYAVFHSPTYRERYAEFLRIDFPRLPLTGDLDLFAALVGHGRALVDLHLMRSSALDTLITTFPESGENEVASRHPKYDEKQQRVYINAAQYFQGVPPEVWGFHVGGYQVLEKWLKDRRGRKLSWDDLQHYQRIVVALRDTMRIMDAIDAAIPAWPLV